MKITMIGHCTVLIETGGKKIVTDPYFGLQGTLVYRRLAPPTRTRKDMRNVDLVLQSHSHWDHIDREYLCLLTNGVPVVAPKRARRAMKLHGAKNLVGMSAWESRHFGEILVTAVPAFHIMRAVGYIVQNEGKQVYFAGDTYYHPFMEKIGRQFQLDVALIPVTTFRIPMTMNERSAVRAVQALKPATVIPVHLGVRPRLSLLDTNQTPERFARRVREAGLETNVIILREGQRWEA
jgi:L-ascorbate metabolism protein UlaG (beta-lactamase superfamily)